MEKDGNRKDGQWSQRLFLKLLVRSTSSFTGIWCEGESLLVNLLRSMLSNQVRSEKIEEREERREEIFTTPTLYDMDSLIA